MQVTIVTPRYFFDINVSGSEPGLTVGRLFETVTGEQAPSTLDIDDWQYRADDLVDSVPMRRGSTISSIVSEPELGVSMYRVSGYGSGEKIQPVGGLLPVDSSSLKGAQTGASRNDGMSPNESGSPGSLGPNAGSVLEADVIEGNQVGFTPVGSEPVWVNGEMVAVGQRVLGSRVGSQLATARIRSKPQTSGRPPIPTLGGRIVLQRAPRTPHEPTIPRPEKPGLPTQPKKHDSFSWFMGLAPLPIIAIAVKVAPYFAVLLAMSPMLAIARWFESRRQAKQDRQRFDQEFSSAISNYAIAMKEWTRNETTRRRAATPDIVELQDWLKVGDKRIWARRPGHEDFLSVNLGLGDMSVSTTVSDFPEADAICRTSSRLRSVPVGVDLASETGIGIVGSPEVRGQLAAAVLLDLVVHHGPTDLNVVILSDQDRQRDVWEWAKWLPHCETSQGAVRAASTIESAREVLRSLPSEKTTRSGESSGNPAVVVVVDSDQYLHRSFAELSRAVADQGARVLVTSSNLADLPSVCSTVVEVDDQPVARIRLGAAGSDSGQAVTATSHENVQPVLISHPVARKLGRRLAGFEDPELPNLSQELPKVCHFDALIGHDVSAEYLVERWRSGTSRPEALLGVSADGPLRIDLSRDGPHMLVAGTTGSGKSELLRAMVASMAVNQSPDKLNFVLIDFKGGGAFDSCVGLPHTVGVVTDLDERLAARALRCLRSELVYRERKLRSAGVTDLKDYHAAGDPLPRLVVVVDEFATLLAELPDFIASLVDIAQRGRSLGINLVLATQKPSGVVDSKIRANTNVRIALRVQDEADSNDVVGIGTAAGISRSTPGRAYLRLGASDVTEFQTASLSPAPPSVSSLHLEQFELVRSRSENSRFGGCGQAGSATDFLGRLTEAASTASRALEIDKPRVPWPEPLPSLVNPERLWDGQTTPRWSAPLGLMDLPDEQRTAGYWWTPQVGHLALYGSDNTATAEVLSSLVVGLALTHSPASAHMYVVDFSGSGQLASMSALSQVGAVVTVREEERLVRLINTLTNVLEQRSDFARKEHITTIDADSNLPLSILAIANFGALVSLLEETDRYEMVGQLEQILRDGPSLGMFVVASANHERGIPIRVSGQIESKLLMKLADPNSYAALGVRPQDLPDFVSGRALDLASGNEVQMSTYSQSVVTKIVESFPPDFPGGPPPITELGTDVACRGIVGQSSKTANGWKLAIGLRYGNLEPLILDLLAGGHVIVSGAPGSGKTTALRSIALAATTADPSVRILVVSSAKTEWSETVSDLSSEVVDKKTPTLILIDDLVGVDEDTTRCIERLAEQDNVWVVLAARPETLQIPPMWVRQIAMARTGIFLNPQPDHGDVMRCRLPIRHPKKYPAGRGYIVNGGVSELGQLSNTSTVDVARFRLATTQLHVAVDGALPSDR